MPLPGGPADKLGNRYELWWTVSQLLEMIQGRAEGIRIEDPQADKVEFVIYRGPQRELHQVKSGEEWTLARMARGDRSLLQAIGSHLAAPEVQFIFVSNSGATELLELADRARYAQSLEEFGAYFVSAQEHARNFERLTKSWNCDASVAFDRLRRVYVRTIDEKGIEQQVRSSIQACFFADPSVVSSELRTLVLDSVHREMTRDELMEHLAQHGFPLRRVNPRNAEDFISEATKRYLDSVRGRLISHKIIPRAATQVLLQRFDGAADDSLLTGKAGAGKSACVVEFIEALQARNVPVLAFRLDRLEPVQTTQALGDRLGLEESPALVLAAAAKGREAALVIDQLDAVSTASGRTSGLFDAMDGLLNEVRGLRVTTPLRVVLVCREFDWKNDPELNQLLPAEQAKVEVAEFSDDETKRHLVETGFNPSLFHASQLRMLQLPQNLSLFLDARFKPQETPAFNNAKELFDKYWDTKRNAVARRVGQTTEQWNDAVETLSQQMTRTQQLSVPKEKLDNISKLYLDQMVSEGVLTFDGKRYGFGHESFFDYVFARSFMRQDKGLVAFLTESEQHLFRRAQVRQVLTYLRDADRERYCGELRALLADARVRIHLKDLAIGLVASVSDPSNDEWVILEQLLRSAFLAAAEGRPNDDRFASLAWRHFWSSPSWFEYADQQGMIREWLAADKSGVVDMAVSYLLGHIRRVPDAVADLLRPYTFSRGEWPQRLRTLIEWADHSISRSLFDFTLQLIEQGTLDEARGPVAANSTFWSMFHDLTTKRPEWIPEVIEYRLRRMIVLKRASNEELRGICGDDVFAAEPFKRASEVAPVVYAQRVLPIVLEIAEQAAPQGPPPRWDSVWPILYKTEYPSPADACLRGLVVALTNLANDPSADLREIVDRLRRADTYVSNFLLLNLYTAGGRRFADEGVRLLCDQPWRFECGFTDSPRWTARELIVTAAPLCSTENRARLEQVLLDYRPRFERMKGRATLIGSSSYDLLSAIPCELRGQTIRTRYQELERKFRAPSQPPRGLTFVYIGSPIENNAAEKMSDDHWLRAIAKYDADDRKYSRDPGKGGAYELAVMLKGYAQKAPERFARLALRFPGGTNPTYYTLVLDALKAASITAQLKLDVARKVYAEYAKQCGSVIADLLGSIERTLPDDAVEMLAWLATEHPDPERELWREQADVGGTYFSGDILNNGINTTRGRAAEAIRDLILRDATYVARFGGTLARMVQDKSAAVLSCVASTLRAIARHDEVMALELFQGIVFADDGLLATPHAYEFIRGGLREHYQTLRPYIARMLRSNDAVVCEAGACLAAIAALEHPEATDVRDQAVAANESMRLGIARVAASNIASPECRNWCEQQLISLFEDESEQVREAAALCFRQLEEQPLAKYETLLSAFCNSKAYTQHSFSMLHLFEHSPYRLPGLTCLVCEKFISRFSNEAGDVPRTGNEPTVAKLVFRTYDQHQRDEWGAKSLDLIDRLCLEGIGEAHQQMAEFER